MDQLTKTERKALREILSDAYHHHHGEAGYEMAKARVERNCGDHVEEEYRLKRWRFHRTRYLQVSSIINKLGL